MFSVSEHAQRAWRRCFVNGMQEVLLIHDYDTPVIALGACTVLLDRDKSNRFEDFLISCAEEYPKQILQVLYLSGIEIQ